MVIGPEVIEETSNTIILHDLSDPVELPQEKCVRRMHLIVDSMHKDAITALKDADVALARDVIDRDADVDRLYWMAVKQYNLILKDRKLSERIGVDVFEGMSLTMVARMIERIGDHAEKIAHNATQAAAPGKPMSGTEEIGKLSAQAIKILDASMEAYFRKDIKSANQIIDMGERLVQQCQEMDVLGRAPSNGSVIVRTSVLDSIARTAMYATDIAEIAINGAMRLDE
jgi:phosphate uptake regulator